METLHLPHFDDLTLCRPILEAIAGEGYDTPTPIQAKAIPPVLDGKDVLGCAQTGTGKTAAFALPILHLLHTRDARSGRQPKSPFKPVRNARGTTPRSQRGSRGAPARRPRVLVLSPTRELAAQIDESFATYGKNTQLRQTVIFGGVNQFRQVKALQRGVDILVATPGRLEDLMEQGHIELSSVEILVLDEADRMLDMGFIEPIRRITSTIPDQRQTLLFSATMPPAIMHLADSLLTDPVKVSVTPAGSTTERIEQSVYMVPHRQKRALLEHLLEERSIQRALVFTRTKHGASKLSERLNRAGVTSDAIHGNRSQGQRTRALEAFRSGASRVLVATDVAARGIDVDEITHVFNFDLPNEPEVYVHRIGRTGRAGATGKAISFCDREERGHLRSIERLTGSPLEPVRGPRELEEAGRQRNDDTSERRRSPRPGSGSGNRRPKRSKTSKSGSGRKNRPASEGPRPPRGGPNSQRSRRGRGRSARQAS